MGLRRRDGGIFLGWDGTGEGTAMSLCFVDSSVAERKIEKLVKVKFELKIKYTYRNLLSVFILILCTIYG